MQQNTNKAFQPHDEVYQKDSYYSKGHRSQWDFQTDKAGFRPYVLLLDLHYKIHPEDSPSRHPMFSYNNHPISQVHMK
jgi:hypothetical protein